MPAGWNEMDVVGGINAALNAVSDVTPLTFTQITDEADITFAFTDKLAEKLKDGTQVIPATADAFTQKHVIYFRPNLTWTSVLPVPAMQHDIIAVAMHELGHVLGLHNHSIERNAAMFFSVRNGLRRYEPDDIERLQARYGGRRELVPGHFGANAAGIDLAVFPGAAGTDLFVGHIDDKDGPNKGQYRVGWVWTSSAGRPRASARSPTWADRSATAPSAWASRSAT